MFFFIVLDLAFMCIGMLLIVKPKEVLRWAKEMNPWTPFLPHIAIDENSVFGQAGARFLGMAFVFFSSFILAMAIAQMADGRSRHVRPPDAAPSIYALRTTDRP